MSRSSSIFRSTGLPQDCACASHLRHRLPFLEAQCGQWTGGIAAATYIPLFNGTIHATPPSVWQQRPLNDALQHVQELFDRLVARGTTLRTTVYMHDHGCAGCKVDMTVFSEQLPDVSDWHSYPANTLRNMALDIAHTEVCDTPDSHLLRVPTPQMVLLLDADFLVAPTRFGDVLHNTSDRSASAALRALLSTDRALVVLPAFNSLVAADDPRAVRVLQGARSWRRARSTHIGTHWYTLVHRRQAGPGQRGGRRARGALSSRLSPRHQLHPLVRAD